MANVSGPCQFSALDMYLSFINSIHESSTCKFGFVASLSYNTGSHHRTSPWENIHIPKSLSQSEVLSWEPVLKEEIAANPSLHVEDGIAKITSSPLTYLVHLITRKLLEGNIRVIGRPFSRNSERMVSPHLKSACPFPFPRRYVF